MAQDSEDKTVAKREKERSERERERERREPGRERRKEEAAKKKTETTEDDEDNQCKGKTQDRSLHRRSKTVRRWFGTVRNPVDIEWHQMISTNERGAPFWGSGSNRPGAFEF
jgi:hypothetical protein